MFIINIKYIATLSITLSTINCSKSWEILGHNGEPPFFSLSTPFCALKWSDVGHPQFIVPGLGQEY